MPNPTPTREPMPEQPLSDPADLRLRAERLSGQKESDLRRQKSLERQLSEIDDYLNIADGVTDALEQLSQQLFRETLDVLQSKLTMAIQDVLQQPVEFMATADFKRGSAVVEFSIRRDGNEEDIRRGQGGSVHNILSVGLRLFALATLDNERHRRFLVLDEQDCWLRPELVPKLVRMVHEAARELDFQVLMISHHDVRLFEDYADKIYRVTPSDKTVRIIEHKSRPTTQDDE